MTETISLAPAVQHGTSLAPEPRAIKKPENSSLVSAVQDVTSVAIELREIKKRAETYGIATTRLQEVSAALTHLATAMSGIQSQYSMLLTKANTVSDQIERARSASEATVNAIPEVVARIEAADVSKTVGDFSRSLSSVNERFAAQVLAIDRMQSLLTKEREEQRTVFDEMAAVLNA